MRSKVIAVDFDGTMIVSTDSELGGGTGWPGVSGQPNYKLIEFLKNWKSAGNKLVLWTCRDGAALENAISWSKEKGLVFDAINDNLPERIERFGSNSRKISCDYYIDDKSILPENFENILYVD